DGAGDRGTRPGGAGQPVCERVPAVAMGPHRGLRPGDCGGAGRALDADPPGRVKMEPNAQRRVSREGAPAMRTIDQRVVNLDALELEHFTKGSTYESRSARIGPGIGAKK